MLKIVNTIIKKNIKESKEDIVYLTVSYSINGKNITYDKLKEIRITKKDYIDYVESVKNGIISTKDKSV